MVVVELFATVIAIFLVGGMGYWAYTFFQKYRFVIKYKILRRSYNVNDVKKMIQYYDAGMSAGDVEKMILLSPSNKRTKSQVREVLYIYSELEKIERRGNK